MRTYGNIFARKWTNESKMKIKDRKSGKLVDVSEKDCPNRPCYWPRPDPGIFNQGQGYRFRSNDWLCGTREIRGCPDVKVNKEREKSDGL